MSKSTSINPEEIDKLVAEEKLNQIETGKAMLIVAMKTIISDRFELDNISPEQNDVLKAWASGYSYDQLKGKKHKDMTPIADAALTQDSNIMSMIRSNALNEYAAALSSAIMRNDPPEGAKLPDMSKQAITTLVDAWALAVTTKAFESSEIQEIIQEKDKIKIYKEDQKAVIEFLNNNAKDKKGDALKPLLEKISSTRSENVIMRNRLVKKAVDHENNVVDIVLRYHQKEENKNQTPSMASRINNTLWGTPELPPIQQDIIAAMHDGRLIDGKPTALYFQEQGLKVYALDPIAYEIQWGQIAPNDTKFTEAYDYTFGMSPLEYAYKNDVKIEGKSAVEFAIDDKFFPKLKIFGMSPEQFAIENDVTIYGKPAAVHFSEKNIELKVKNEQGKDEDVDPVKHAISNNFKIGGVDAPEYAVKNDLKLGGVFSAAEYCSTNGKLIEGKDAIQYAVDNNFKIEKQDAAKYVVINNIKIDLEPAAKYLIEKNIQIEGEHAAKYLIEKNIKIDGKDAAKYLIEENLKIDGKPAVEYLLENDIKINDQTKKSNKPIKRDAMKYAIRNDANIGTEHAALYASKKEYKINGMDPLVYYAQKNGIQTTDDLINKVSPNRPEMLLGDYQYTINLIAKDRSDIQKHLDSYGINNNTLKKTLSQLIRKTLSGGSSYIPTTPKGPTTNKAKSAGREQ